ncbi:ATP-binding protein [Bailinhaonella thermotolerans]|uniref:ATP-binding protein n=1 Tax=Bailinhaonella thermotolerans TaxID=1070861 RepID=UPI00192A2E87|nr:ATP-binding protein [Bailinhaonella thermotolerans]
MLEAVFTLGDLVLVRGFVSEQAARAGLTGLRLKDFVLAVHELMANAILHGGGGGRVSLRRHDGRLLCTVSDQGPGLGDRTLPSEQPGLDSSRGGRGLWLVRQIGDEVDVTTGPAGTSITISMVLI